jgi:hypothetical protein
MLEKAQQRSREEGLRPISSARHDAGRRSFCQQSTKRLSAITLVETVVSVIEILQQSTFSKGGFGLRIGF